jgi:hypothetical protein
MKTKHLLRWVMSFLYAIVLVGAIIVASLKCPEALLAIIVGASIIIMTILIAFMVHKYLFDETTYRR